MPSTTAGISCTAPASPPAGAVPLPAPVPFPVPLPAAVALPPPSVALVTLPVALPAAVALVSVPLPAAVALPASVPFTAVPFTAVPLVLVTLERSASGQSIWIAAADQEPKLPVLVAQATHCAKSSIWGQLCYEWGAAVLVEHSVTRLRTLSAGEE